MIKGIYCKLRFMNVLVTVLTPWQWLPHERIPETEDGLGQFPSCPQTDGGMDGCQTFLCFLYRFYVTQQSTTETAGPVPLM